MAKKDEQISPAKWQKTLFERVHYKWSRVAIAKASEDWQSQKRQVAAVCN